MNPTFLTFQNKYYKEVLEKILKFTANEISSFDFKIPNFENLDEKIKSNSRKFIEQFAQFNPLFKPVFFSDKLENSYKKTYSRNNLNNLEEFFQNQIDLNRWRINKIHDRLNDPYTFTNFSKYYATILKSISEHLQKCELGKQSVKLEFPNHEYIELALRYEFYQFLSNFQINNLFYIFKHFAILRRKEIFNIVIQRLTDDLLFEQEQSSFQTVFETPEEIINDLKRLSSTLNIKFEINSHDGQHFSYFCEKIYYENLNKKIDFDLDLYSKEPIPSNKNPDFNDRINQIFLENSQVDLSVKFSFDNLIEADNERGIEISMKKYNIELIKILQKDKIASLLRLQFARNKSLLFSISQSIKEIETLKHKILQDNDSSDFFGKYLNIIRKTTLIIVSNIKSIKRREEINIDNDILIEKILDLYDQLLKSKILIFNVFYEIKDNSYQPNIHEKITSLTNAILDFWPDLVSGNHKTCFSAFKLSIDIMTMISNSLRTLINLQIVSHYEFSDKYKSLFEMFEFPAITQTYQISKETFPYSPYEIFPFLDKVLVFLEFYKEIASELTDSFAVRSYHYKLYFEYAVWSQLINEMPKMLTNSTPQSYLFTSEISEKVSMTMTSNILNDLDFVIDLINGTKGRKGIFCIKLREMIHLGWKLEQFLIKTDLCLAIYREQLDTIQNDQRKILLDFSYGDYEFSAISHDWESTELEKIVFAQHNYKLSIETAIRFNNYHLDIFHIEKTLKMNQYKDSISNDIKDITIQKIQTLLFYEPDLINTSFFSLSFCFISAVSNFLDSEKLSYIFVSYSLRSEIAFIEILERNLVHLYPTYEVFQLSNDHSNLHFTVFSFNQSANREGRPTSYDLVDSDDNINHFVIPTIPQSLAIDKKKETLYNILKFVLVRFQTLKYALHDSYLSQTRPKTIENIYKEKLLWISPIFSRINVEINRHNESNEIPFSLDYFTNELETFCSKQFLVAISMIKDTILQKDAPSTPNSNALVPDKIAKSYLVNMMKPPPGHLSFMTEMLYIPFYLNQFWHQCDEQFRADFLNHQSKIEQIVDDSVVGFQDQEYRITSHDFSLGSVRLEFLIFAFYNILFSEDEIEKLDIYSIIDNLTYEILKRGKEKYDMNINIKATSKIGSVSSKGTIETRLLDLRTAILKDTLLELANQHQIEIIKNTFSKEMDNLNMTFSIPNILLKPECYKERIQINSSHVSFLPSINSLKEQFIQEVKYARSRFCHILARFVSTSLKSVGYFDVQEENNDENDDQEANFSLNTTDTEIFSINLNVFKDKIQELSALMTSFLNIGSNQLHRIWSGYIQNGIIDFNSNTESQILTNLFIKNFIKRFNELVLINVSAKMKDNYLMLSKLRDKEWAIYREQEQYEKQKEKEMREEYTILINDLHDEIIKAKFKFVQVKEAIFNCAGGSYSKYNDGSQLMDEVINNISKVEKIQEKLESGTPELIHSLLPKETTQPKLDKIDDQATDSLSHSQETEPLKSIRSYSEFPEDIDPILVTSTKKATPVSEFKTNTQKKGNIRESMTAVNQFPKLDDPLTPSRRRKRNASFRSKANSKRMSINPRQGFSINEPTSKRKDSARRRKSVKQDDENNANEQIKSEEVSIDIEFPKKDTKKPKTITEKIEDTQKEIDELNKLRKMLRITTTMCGIAVKKIYSRMITQVGEQKKNYSISLWSNKRVFEEDMDELNKDIRDAYSRLTKAEIEIENLNSEIAEAKKKNVKLLHYKEMNIREVDKFHKELRKFSNVGDINITQLLEKINRKQDELEMLMYDQQKLDEEIYFQVQEPMRQLDQFKRQLRFKKANFSVKPKPPQQPVPFSKRAKMEVNKIFETNKILHKQNAEIRARITELEDKLSNIPADKLNSIINNLYEPDISSARTKSNKLDKRIVKPNQNVSKPNTARY